MRHTLAAAVFLLSVSCAFGQTASDFETRFGKPVSSYVVSEHLWMTPEYSAGGEVCRVRLHPRRVAPGVNYLSPIIPFEELKEVLDRLVPLQERGAKKDPFRSGAAGGGTEWMIYSYERVTVTVVSSFRVDPDSRSERKSFAFTVGASPSPNGPETPAASANDFSPGLQSDAEIVTVRWNNRKCTGD